MTYCKCHIYIRGRHKWKKQSITYINGGGISCSGKIRSAISPLLTVGLS